jgi:tRNA(Ile)-lysidine synthase
MNPQVLAVASSSNKISILDRVRASIARHEMLRAGNRVGVAVSGGADSVALALLLRELRSELGATFFIVHFNHKLRGVDSDRDQQFVCELAARLGWDFVSGGADVAGRAQEDGWNLEDAGRRLRYEFFAKAAAEQRADRIAVAHTADDQAETVIAQILRGTGPTGLAGIYPIARQVIRPMLEIRREELRLFLNARREVWREDASNEDETRLRARIRRRLVPVLEQTFQPAVVDHLGRLAELAREDEQFWRALVDERFAALARIRPGRVEIEIARLLRPFAASSVPRGKEPRFAGDKSQLALTKRLIRRILEEVRGERLGFTSRHIEDVLMLATYSASGHRIELPGGIYVEKSFGVLIFTRPSDVATAKRADRKSRSASTFSHPVPLDGDSLATIEIPEIGHRLSLKVIDWPPAPRDTILQAIDWGCLRAPIVVRNWRPGDAYRPHGHLRTHKLKELFRVKRVPASERPAWPVLTSAGSVVWARGFPVAEGFAASNATRRSVVVIEEPL